LFWFDVGVSEAPCALARALSDYEFLRFESSVFSLCALIYLLYPRCARSLTLWCYTCSESLTLTYFYYTSCSFRDLRVSFTNVSLRSPCSETRRLYLNATGRLLEGAFGSLYAPCIQFPFTASESFSRPQSPTSSISRTHLLYYFSGSFAYLSFSKSPRLLGVVSTGKTFRDSSAHDRACGRKYGEYILRLICVLPCV